MGITPASAFRQRKAVALPTGRTVEIRKLQPMDFQVEATRLFELADMTQEQIQKRLLQDPGLFQVAFKALEQIFTKGVVSPKVSAKPIDELAPDEVHISDIGEDAMPLLQAILQFSGVDLTTGQVI